MPERKKGHATPGRALLSKKDVVDALRPSEEGEPRPFAKIEEVLLVSWEALGMLDRYLDRFCDRGCDAEQICAKAVRQLENRLRWDTELIDDSTADDAPNERLTKSLYHLLLSLMGVWWRGSFTRLSGCHKDVHKRTPPRRLDPADFEAPLSPFEGGERILRWMAIARLLADAEPIERSIVIAFVRGTPPTAIAAAHGMTLNKVLAVLKRFAERLAQ